MGSILKLRKVADYDAAARDEAGNPVREPRLDDHGEPVLDGNGKPLFHPFPLKEVRVDGDPPSQMTFSEPFVQQALAEGWASLGRGRLTIHAADGDVVYAIVRAPGRYEDPSEPSGWRKDTFYTCSLVEAPLRAGVEG